MTAGGTREGAGRWFSRRALTRGVGYNLGAIAVPAVLGLATLPILAEELGTGRLGILLLVWAVLAYLSLLHFGIGRALSYAAASGRPDLGALALTGVGMAWGAGAFGAAALYVAAPSIAGVLQLAPEHADEAVTCFRILSVALPFTVGSAALQGLVEARGRFAALAGVAMAVSTGSYLGPVAVLAVGGGLKEVVAAVASARVLGWVALVLLCRRAYRHERPGRPTYAHAVDLFRFGGWTTVSSVVSPMMVYMDRFVVGALVSASAVAFYAAPQEVVTRLGSVSGSVAIVLFPAFAAAGASSRERIAPLLRGGSEAVFVLVLPVSLVLLAGASPGLDLWLGPEFAREGAVVVSWLAVGLFANGLAKPAAVLVTAAGRPDAVARVHMAEVGIYALLLFPLVSAWGIAGAAFAWALRSAADGAAMYWLAVRLFPDAAPAAAGARRLGAAGLVALALTAAAGAPSARAAVAAVGIAAVAVFAVHRGYVPNPLTLRARRRAEAEN